MKKLLRRILKWTGRILLAALIGLLLWRLLYGRNLICIPHDTAYQPRVELSYAEAAADGTITPEEVAVHYAPEIDAAVNVLLSGAGRGDFLAAVDYDGDWSARNNWENLHTHPLNAVVYYSVQETDTHWYAGYYFYHPRDDAEIWLDRHENDMEGIMLAIPKDSGSFLPPVCMYTQGHGLVPFYLNRDAVSWQVADGNRDGGGMLLDGDHPIVYITPNGTLDHAGHSVESALGHSTYWAAGNSGVRYFHGGTAEEPAFFNGAYEQNRCSYALRPLEELWSFRSGPYNGSSPFGSYGALDGNNWGEDRANPPWAWRNKTIHGFGGAFLSDPVWTLNNAIDGAALSAEYLRNDFADWKLTLTQAVLPRTADPASCTLHLFRDGWEFSNPAWFTLTDAGNGRYNVTFCGGRSTLYVASPAGGSWRMEVRDASGKMIIGAAAAVKAEYLGQ